MRSPIKGVTAGGRRQPVEMRTGVDGRTFSASTDEAIDRIVHQALNNEAGRRLMEYLEGITLRTVLPPGASAEDLREMEAQRRLVAMLKARARRTNDER